MKPVDILNSVIGAVAVGLLSIIARLLHRSYKRFDRFMEEHMWLIATSLWTRDKVITMMSMLGVDYPDPPPADLKGKHRNGTS